MSVYKLFLSAQKEFPTIPKDRTATIPTKNGGKYSYKYADLSDVLYAVRPVLHKFGFTICQELLDGRLITRFYHETGECIVNAITAVIPEHVTPQEMGSLLTYYRRYGLCAALGVVAEEDDDGRAYQPSPTTVKGAPPKESLVASHGDYIVPFGKKFKGKRLSELDKGELSDYCQWIEGEAHKKGEPPSEAVQNFLDAAAQYLSP